MKHKFQINNNESLEESNLYTRFWWIFLVFRPVHCTFDLPLCGLVNDWTSSGDKWTERTGPVSERGPQTDHSNGAGEETLHDYPYNRL